MMTKEEAYKLRSIIEKTAVFLDDKDASEGASLFPRLKQDGSLVKAGTRINWNGTIKRAANSLWDTVENDPDHAPAMWNDIEYREGLRVLTGPIPATTPVQVDEICWYKDEKWRNILGVPSVYLPDEYPDGWEKVEA